MALQGAGGQEASRGEESSLISILGVGPAVSSMLFSGAVGVNKLPKLSSSGNRTIAIVSAGRQPGAVDLQQFALRLAA